MSSALFNETCVDMLRDGYGVRFRAGGTSMHPTIRDGELITVESLSGCRFAIGDIILYRSERGVVAHRLMKIEKREKESVYILRGDAAYAPDEPVTEGRLLGRVIAVQRRGRTINLNRAASRTIQLLGRIAFRLKQKRLYRKDTIPAIFSTQTRITEGAGISGMCLAMTDSLHND